MCKTETFPLNNVHEHQIEFMRAFEEQKGIAFLLIFFAGEETYYYMRFSELKGYVERAEGGGRKSVRVDELDPDFFLPTERGAFIPYLEGVQRDLDRREA